MTEANRSHGRVGWGAPDAVGETAALVAADRAAFDCERAFIGDTAAVASIIDDHGIADDQRAKDRVVAAAAFGKIFLPLQ